MLNLVQFQSNYTELNQVNNKKKLKIAIGTDAFPPTTDGISNVAQSYAQIINKNIEKYSEPLPKR